MKQFLLLTLLSILFIACNHGGRSVQRERHYLEDSCIARIKLVTDTILALGYDNLKAESRCFLTQSQQHRRDRLIETYKDFIEALRLYKTDSPAPVRKSYEMQIPSIDIGSKYLNISYTCYEQKRFRESLHFAYLAQRHLVKSHKGWTARSACQIAKSYQALGIFDSAYYYLAQGKESQIAYIKETQNKRIAQIQLNHELKQVCNIKRNLIFQNSNQATILQQQRIIFIVFTVLTSTVGLFILFFYRQRKLRGDKTNLELEQRLLRSQMNPHFIFNTLSTLASFIRQHDVAKATKYLNKFARLLRVSLENASEPFVSLSSELDALEHYLSLQSLRFNPFFDYYIQILHNESVDNIMIPPMLIQPFVENFFEHGLQRLDYRATLGITIEKGEGLIFCVIDDNGRGFRENKENGDKKSISTHLTQTRLKILSRQMKQCASLKVIDKKQVGLGNGVRVELNIPFHRQHC